jgi:hypothetical protein
MHFRDVRAQQSHHRAKRVGLSLFEPQSLGKAYLSGQIMTLGRKIRDFRRLRLYDVRSEKNIISLRCEEAALGCLQRALNSRLLPAASFRVRCAVTIKPWWQTSSATPRLGMSSALSQETNTSNTPKRKTPNCGRSMFTRKSRDTWRTMAPLRHPRRNHRSSMKPRASAQERATTRRLRRARMSVTGTMRPAV